jgi:hypothetical protein
MQVFTYSFFWRIVYRYGNFVVTPLLLIQLFLLAFWLDKNLIMLFPFLISLFVLYYINKKYFEFYKLVPYKIESDDEKIICSQLLFQKKIIRVYYKDIDALSGGIFDGKYRGLMQVCDGKNKICIGFFDRLINYQKLISCIVSRVDKKVYDETIPKLQSFKVKN